MITATLTDIGIACRTLMASTIAGRAVILSYYIYILFPCCRKHISADDDHTGIHMDVHSAAVVYDAPCAA